MVYSLLKLTFHRLIRFSPATVLDSPTDSNPLSTVSLGRSLPGVKDAISVEHPDISKLLTAKMSRQFISLRRPPTVTRSMVELPTASSISPTTSQSRMASSDPTSHGGSPTSPSSPSSHPWPFSSTQDRRSRDRTRRRVASPTLQLQQEQRSRSLPPLPRTPPAPLDAGSPNAPIVAYTDASCVQERASGIGIFFGENHPLNTSKALPGPEHNSGIAEIIAAQTALAKILEWKEFKGQPVVIRTDYMGVIDAMNNGNYGRFSGLYADLRRLAERFPSVTFEHVYGHDGEKGNEMADQLARDAIRLRRRSVTPNGREGERSRSRSRDGRSRSATIKGRRNRTKSPPKVSDPSKVPPPDPSRSRSRSKSKNRKKSRCEVMKGVTNGRNSPSRSVRSMQRSERRNTQRQMSQRSQRRNRSRRQERR